MAAPPLTLPIEPAWDRLATRGREVLSAHDRLSRLIKAQAGADAAGLLAAPVIRDGTVLGWQSPFGGALVPAGDAARVQHVDMAHRIEEVASRLDGQGEAGAVAAHSLRSALVTPEGVEALYQDSTTGNPVLVLWGMAKPGQDRPALAAPSAAPVSAAPTAGTATTGMHLAPVRRAGAMWWPWLLPVSLAAGLAYLALLAAEPLPVETRTIIPPAPPAIDPTVALRPQLPLLEAALGESGAAQPRFLSACVAPPEPQVVKVPAQPELRQRVTPQPDTPEPPLAAPEPTPPAAPEQVTVVEQPAPSLAPSEAPAPKPKGNPPRVVVQPQKPRPTPVRPVPTRPEPAKPQPVKPVPVEEPRVAQRPAPARPKPSARAACNPTWPPGRSPRMIFVVDGSGSMNDSIPGASSRMQAAKRSVGGVVRGLHKDIRIGMVSFSDCNATSNSRYYSAGERGRLIGRVNAMRPGRATSLASSITRAGAMATRRAETVIVVVSDGQDTCGKDPCAAARAVKRRKPNVKINVIDLSGGSARGVLSCVARAGGGRVYTPRSSGQMGAQVQRATGQPNASGC